MLPEYDYDPVLEQAKAALCVVHAIDSALFGQAFADCNLAQELGVSVEEIEAERARLRAAGGPGGGGGR